MVQNCQGGYLMNGMELIMKLQKKMQDPAFAEKFSRLANEISGIPGLQQEVMRISQISNERDREKALDRLPSKVKKSVTEMIKLLG